uniref:Uncharacterized protein n=1 Tax=Cryptomonas curvata TaxID=233186 RepID=A0A7S0QU35_9CRYP
MHGRLGARGKRRGADWKRVTGQSGWGMERDEDGPVAWQRLGNPRYARHRVRRLVRKKSPARLEDEGVRKQNASQLLAEWLTDQCEQNKPLWNEICRRAE